MWREEQRDSRPDDRSEGDTGSAEVQVAVRADAPPTVTITRPLDGAALTEGRFAVVNAAAVDDIGVTSVSFTVSGLNGTTSFMDATAPALLVAQSIGRVGNYFNQELFGRPTSLPWGIEIDPANRPEGAEVDNTGDH